MQKHNVVLGLGVLILCVGSFPLFGANNLSIAGKVGEINSVQFSVIDADTVGGTSESDRLVGVIVINNNDKDGFNVSVKQVSPPGVPEKSHIASNIFFSGGTGLTGVDVPSNFPTIDAPFDLKKNGPLLLEFKDHRTSSTVDYALNLHLVDHDVVSELPYIEVMITDR